jgi:hypothetical protein
MLPVAFAATLLAAVASGSIFSGSRFPSAADNPDVARVCHAIETLSYLDQDLTNRLLRDVHPGRSDNDSPLPWPLLPHELLGVDISKQPFSSSPPNKNLAAWEESLEVATTKALEPWLRLERGNKKLHDALSVALLCLRRPALLSAYRNMLRKLMEGWWPWGQTVTQHSEKRWRILGEVCGWVEQEEAGFHGWEL